MVSDADDAVATGPATTGGGTPLAMRSTSMLLAEYRSLVAERAPLVRSRVAGRRGFHEMRLIADGVDEQRSPVRWAYLAQLGTLDKLEMILTREGVYETFELLAIARNLLENHVWLKLLRADPNYGLVFYARFLSEQVQNYEAYLVKLHSEAELFASMVNLENEIRESTVIAPVKAKPDMSAAELEVILAAQKAGERELDDMVRREFSLYAGQATFNGYAYQATLLRKRAIPAYEARLAEALAERDALFAHLPDVLTRRHLVLATGRASAWNWRERAIEAHLSKHYDFLYGYTSKLLHSTPMNIITDKQLDDSEARMILDYIVVTAHDILDQIEAYAPPGQVDAVAITMDGDEATV